MNTRWRTAAHVVIDPLPADWREQLARRLGQRPRRIGAWTELALYGARVCLDAAQEEALPAGALLRVASLSGPRSATHAIVEQSRMGLPMPFSFMQSQPSQMLAALGQHLAWQGDARFTLCRDREATLQLAQLESGAPGVLIGWVEEDLRTEWWRLVTDATD
ncbi:MAG TPA: hypothetical protein VHQ87_02130 [Rhizobacter sp.]|nr:hypothetical protein [Rhizobacter sp.]